MSSSGPSPKAGRCPPDPRVDRSMQIIREATARGCRIRRVHVMDLPLNLYLRYELAAYRENIDAGEEVGIALRRWHQDLAELTEDFVLFDPEGPQPDVVWMRYDDQGQLAGLAHSDKPADVALAAELPRGRLGSCGAAGRVHDPGRGGLITAVHPFGELSARRQELGAALRRLRKAAGLSGEEMAAALGISQSRVSRMELGQQIAAPAVVDGWARAAGASDTERETLLGIAEAAAAEMVSWRKAMARGLAKLQEDSRELEASAATILNFQTAGIPGLLQVPEYARRAIRDGAPGHGGRHRRGGGGQDEPAGHRLRRVQAPRVRHDRGGRTLAARPREPDARPAREDHRRLRPGKRDDRDHPAVGRGRRVARPRIQHPR